MGAVSETISGFPQHLESVAILSEMKRTELSSLSLSLSLARSLAACYCQMTESDNWENQTKTENGDIL